MAKKSNILQLVSTFIGAIGIGLVKLYQYLISPMLGSHCRHIPSCSQYMIEAIKMWGPFKGVYLGLRRLARCHPWGTSGYDPVPKKEQKS